MVLGKIMKLKACYLHFLSTHFVLIFFLLFLKCITTLPPFNPVKNRFIPQKLGLLFCNKILNFHLTFYFALFVVCHTQSKKLDLNTKILMKLIRLNYHRKIMTHVLVLRVYLLILISNAFCYYVFIDN